MGTNCQVQILAEIGPAEAVEQLIELHQTLGHGKVLVKQGKCFHSPLLQNQTGVFSEEL
jgi:hypothetical protein